MKEFSGKNLTALVTYFPMWLSVFCITCESTLTIYKQQTLLNFLLKDRCYHLIISHLISLQQYISKEYTTTLDLLTDDIMTI